MEVPFTRPGTWPGGIDPSRMAARIRSTMDPGCRVAILGLGDDLGVRLNHGRPGAAAGPGAFRAALARYGVARPYNWEWPGVFDAGDVEPAGGGDEAALHETHRRVTAAAAALLNAGLFPIGIGGGHDLTFAFVRAVADRCRPLAGLYFDAHLDVRETAGSGMAFRRLVEDCGVRGLDVHGLNVLVNSREHMEWFTAHGGRVRAPWVSPGEGRGASEGVYPSDPLPTPMPAGGSAFPSGDCFASFDLDVLDVSCAPGVSAANPCGWHPHQAEQWMFSLGRRKEVRCLDIMELNPVFDPDGRTARLAAHLFLSFLTGFARRPA